MTLEKPLEIAFRYDFGKVSANVGVALLAYLRVDDAVKVCSKALQILEPIAKAHPQELKYTLELARNCRVLAEAQALSETNETTKSTSDIWIARTITLLDGMPAQNHGLCRKPERS